MQVFHVNIHDGMMPNVRVEGINLYGEIHGTELVIY